MAINGPGIETVFATLFNPSGPRKGRQNANMKVVFSDEDFKNGV
jgi:hypothetical protein